MSERVQGGAAAGRNSGAAAGDDAAGDHKVKLAIAWTVVGVPLAYGVVSVVIRASQLFTQ